jgi:ribonuclease III
MSLPPLAVEAQARIGHTFANPSLLVLALTHASVADCRASSNERLEFLGDAVLGLVCCEMLYRLYPNLLEGEMTKIKSSVVSRQTCARIASDLGLDRLLILGKGIKSQRSVPQSLAAAAVESVIAAMYLDGGIEAARGFLEPLLEPLIRAAAASGHQENFKSVLQQYAQQSGQSTPAYMVLDEKGPDHSKCFEVCAEIGVRRFSSCWGASKKQAEQQAALLALRELGIVTDGPNGHVAMVQKDTGASGND